MKTGICAALCALAPVGSSSLALAAPALQVLGHAYTFPNKFDGLPAKLSDFPGLQINNFETRDGVKLSYWEAGTGKPLVFIPGWSANGAEYINVLYLLAKSYHIYVLDRPTRGCRSASTTARASRASRPASRSSRIIWA